jgi:hypothetical protein
LFAYFGILPNNSQSDTFGRRGVDADNMAAQLRDDDGCEHASRGAGHSSTFLVFWAEQVHSTFTGTKLQATWICQYPAKLGASAARKRSIRCSRGDLRDQLDKAQYFKTP